MECLKAAVLVGYFDNHCQLKWDKHIDTIETKADRSLRLIKYAKKYLLSDVVKKIYRGIIEPHLSYCCSVWDSSSESKISVLQKIQNRAARIVTNSPYGAAAAPLIHNLGRTAISKLLKKSLQVSELTCP